jgi:UDPglucose 6-dehydrogenase
MRVGFVGLGKLGFPCALAIAMKGHQVYGYDINPDAMTTEPRIYKEAGVDGTGDLNDYLGENFPEYLNDEVGTGGCLKFSSLEEIGKKCEIIFMAIQTPHEPQFEGSTRIPDDRCDFNYDALETAAKNLSDHIHKKTAVVIISTVLPGTIRNRIMSVLNDNVKLCYNPFFIAMGTTMRDFLNPEFTLFGVEDWWSANMAKILYHSIHDAPFYECTIEEAELIKVSYNTFIGMKIVFANTLMEIAHGTENCNVDHVTDGLKLAHRRLISPAYLSGGMGDGGGCHPRDNIAMSWLARERSLSHDLFNDIMATREDQAEWLCGLVARAYDGMYKIDSEKPILILGTSFKPESNIEVGSPALLCKNILEEMGYAVVDYDPFVDAPQGFGWPLNSRTGEIILIGTKHEVFKNWRFPVGSVVIDPFRYLPDQDGVEIIRVGE